MTNTERDAARYWRLRVLGCAPCESKQLENGTVLRFNNLDEFVDHDIKIRPSRGEAELYERKVAAPAQGTPEPPKVDIRQKCVNFLCLRPDPKVDELAEFVESLLSPYFPPASQTPKWKCFHCFFETSDYAKAEAHFGDGEGDSAICLYWSKLSTEDRLQEFQDLVQQLNGERDEGAALLARAEKAEKELARLATPASTARTDGWVSVEERLPELDIPVLIWRFGFIVRERIEYAVVAKLVRNIEDEGADKYWEDWSGDDISCGNVTHWRELPAAPGSVPQAPDPLKDDSRCAVCCWPLAESAEKGCVRGNCSMRPFPEVFYDLERAEREYGKKFGVQVGVPQAEPPKTWKEKVNAMEDAALNPAAQPGDAPQKEKP